ncbi:LysM peptidoglycan-binding domain-containing protein [Alteromonas facilis]|uniref:LysM peptidoglycan-binding domain-containing protein n=1 Tax=Alteromonas facilis TaxID=2048004 RepID=UPI0013DCCAA6|nr:LysM peptidoglycan-binding domain-containing protein [Alteromonas facilis]
MGKILFLLLCVGLFVNGCANPHSNESAAKNIAKPLTTKTVQSLINAYLKNNNVEKARELLATIPQQDFTSSLFLSKAELHFLEGSMDEAEAALSMANSLGTDSVFKQTQPSLISVLCSQNRFHTLEQIVQHWDGSQPDDFSIQQAIMCLLRQERFDELVNLFNPAMVSDNSEAFLHLFAARVLLAKENRSAAFEQYQMFIQKREIVSAEILWQEIEYLRYANNPKAMGEVIAVLISLYPDSQEALKGRTLSQISNLPIDGNDKSPSNTQQKKQKSVEGLDTNAVTHDIEKGETLYSISKKYGVSVDELRRLNSALDIYDISIGTRLIISN